MYRQFQTIPISELRVKSYINNPNSLPDDVVVYLGFIQNQFIAFRTLFAGCIKCENENTRFAWCSGNWVHQDFRRKGVSEKLLNEAFVDWNGKLMFTNYAPNSEKLYLKTGRFQAIHQFNGFRAYLFPKTRKLMHVANKNELTKAVFSVLDFGISVISIIRLWFFTGKQNPDFTFETVQYPDEDCFEITRNNKINYLLKRGEKEFNWIFNFPWLTDNEDFNSDKYPFSSYSNSFFYKTVKVIVDNIFIGFFIFSVRNGHLKTLHFHIPKGVEKEVAIFLKQFCVNEKIEVFTAYKYELAQQLFEQKFPFLHAKKYGQKIYSSFEIKDIDNYLFQDGDGDVIFT
jgi:GNAT superfamily N-acetyltransferase